jgi:hypothetical protein
VEELVSIQAKVVEKSLYSVSYWNSYLAHSPTELSNEFNVGLGRNDAIILLKLQDLSSPTILRVYYDTRKYAYTLNLLPESVVQIKRLGLYLSKSKNLYGSVLPISTISFLAESNENASIQTFIEEPRICFLKDLDSELSSVAVNVTLIRKIVLKRNIYKKSDSADISGTLSCKIADGHTEAFGDLDHLDSIFELLRATKDQQDYLKECVCEFGDIIFSNDDEKEDECKEQLELLQVKTVAKAQELLRYLSQSCIGPELKLMNCRKKTQSDVYKSRSLRGKWITLVKGQAFVQIERLRRQTATEWIQTFLNDLQTY